MQGVREEDLLGSPYGFLDEGLVGGGGRLLCPTLWNNVFLSELSVLSHFLPVKYLRWDHPPAGPARVRLCRRSTFMQVFIAVLVGPRRDGEKVR